MNEIVIDSRAVERTSLQRAIAELDREIEIKARTVKAGNDRVKDLVEDLAEHKAVKEAKLQLDIANGDLKVAVLRSQEISEAKEQLIGMRQDLKDTKDILSQHLVEYSLKNRVASVMIEDENKTIVLTAKLGKTSLDQQELPL